VNKTYPVVDLTSVKEVAKSESAYPKIDSDMDFVFIDWFGTLVDFMVITASFTSAIVTNGINTMIE
jgi:hypothetical protein